MSALAPARRFIGPVAPRLIRHGRPLPILTRPQQQRRGITAEQKPLPTKDTPGKGPNQDQQPSVSEEAAATAKITGERGPELDQGTPVSEVLKRDKEASKNAPQVFKDEAAAKSKPSGSRSFSTSTRALNALESASASALEPAAASFVAVAGLKFEPPAPLGQHDHLKRREPEIIQRATRLLMKDGKLAKAQTDMARILNVLRTSNPPRVNPERPLHPDSPPASQLPLDPVAYFTCAIDSVAPLVRLQSMKGFAGGGAALQIPQPLGVWQRRRQAMEWILDSVSKKRHKGPPKGMFAQQFADELISIVEGRSALWERRGALHKLSTVARSNLAKVERMQARRR